MCKKGREGSREESSRGRVKIEGGVQGGVGGGGEKREIAAKGIGGM